MAQNASGVEARGHKKKQKKIKKCGCVPPLVLLGARGCPRNQFLTILGQIWDVFSMFFGTLFVYIFGGQSIDRSSSLSAVLFSELLFGTPLA